MNLVTVPIEEILPPSYSVRQVGTDEDMAELVRSIASKGLLNPLSVVVEDGRYRILAGHRRYIAVKGLGYREVDCNVLALDAGERMAVTVEENLARADIDPVDLGRYFCHLVNDEGMTQTDIGKRLGKSLGWVQSFVRLTRMSEPMQLLVQERKLPAQGALLLDAVENEAMREILTRDAVTQGQSYHAIRTRIASYRSDQANLDRAVETVQQVREDQRASRDEMRCFGCGIPARERSGDTRWLCLGCQRAIDEARDRVDAAGG